MQFIDMHCDSLMMLQLKDPEKADLYQSEITSVDIVRMKKGGQMAQFFVAFMLPEMVWNYFNVSPVSDEEYILKR